MRRISQVTIMATCGAEAPPGAPHLSYTWLRSTGAVWNCDGPEGLPFICSKFQVEQKSQYYAIVEYSDFDLYDMQYRIGVSLSPTKHGYYQEPATIENDNSDGMNLSPGCVPYFYQAPIECLKGTSMCTTEIVPEVSGIVADDLNHYLDKNSGNLHVDPLVAQCSSENQTILIGKVIHPTLKVSKTPFRKLFTDGISGVDPHRLNAEVWFPTRGYVPEDVWLAENFLDGYPDLSNWLVSYENINFPYRVVVDDHINLAGYCEAVTWSPPVNGRYLTNVVKVNPNRLPHYLLTEAEGWVRFKMQEMKLCLATRTWVSNIHLIRDDLALFVARLTPATHCLRVVALDNIGGWGANWYPSQCIVHCGGPFTIVVKGYRYLLVGSTRVFLPDSGGAPTMYMVAQ